MSVWAIDGGEIPASNARTVLFQATGGARGVALATDMQVKPLATPGAFVEVHPGSCVMPNDYIGGTNGGGQAYGIQLESKVSVAVPATGSSGGATRYVIARVNDPEFGAAKPSNPVTYKYDSYHVVSSLPTTYPYVPLARINQPANTTVITKAMITSIRKVANPRSSTSVYARPMVMGDDVGIALELNSRTPYPAGEWFPNKGGPANNGSYVFDIPIWATRMQIRCEWLGVRYAAKAGWGMFWVSYGPSAGIPSPPHNTQAFQFDANESNTYRANWILHDDVYVPAAMRGDQNQAFVPRAYFKNPKGGAYTGKVELDALSGMVMSIRFLEEADED